MINTHRIPFICAFVLLAWSSAEAQMERVANKDWMLQGSSYEATITERGEDLVLTNGLVERVFRNGTTVGLNNQVNGEGMLRSIRPEAELVIDQVKIPVGGLTGQPIHNYFLPEWLNQMPADSMAFPCVGYEVSEIESRFDWKPRKEWMSYNPAWPAKGKMLTFTYKADDGLIERLAARFSSDENRTYFFQDDFRVLTDEWQVRTSPENKANSFVNEGKPGEILIPAHTASFAERKLPAETEVLIARINPGTDQGTTWGPGLAWVFSNKTVKIYLQTAENKFGITGAGLEYEMSFPGLRPGIPVYVKMQRIQHKVACSYSYDGKQWTGLREVALPQDAMSQAVRVGKMDAASGNGEAAEKGAPGRCRIELVKAGGGFSDKTTKDPYHYLKQVEVEVNYEMYDHIPLISKWVTIRNNSAKSIQLNTYKSEILAVMEPENSTVFNRSFMTPNITVETDLVHCNKQDRNDIYLNKAIQNNAHWTRDELYTTQIDWLMNIPCLLETYPEYGPDAVLAKGDTFHTHRIWELFHDSWDRERKALQVRRMYRISAPWVAENPIFMHVRSADNESVKKAIDQCAEVGFEMVIMTFWSGVDLENPAPENLNRMKELADYAHAKGIALGGYSLLASRSIDAENDVVMPAGKTPMFGASPCIGSKWGQQYMQNLETYFKTTGQDILEHDGSYPGDECASENHPGHRGLADSQWSQYQTIKSFYQWCKSQGIFLNVPDWYYMNGQNKTGMGYRETNWSLPREQQEVIERQNIFDGTWTKTPSMGWMMVPLVEYHGGGKDATIEPLKDHLTHYEMRLANNFGAGVMACYRGPQLYDAPETKAVIKKWVDFYKGHRALLDSDLIHLRRPDGTDWDGFIHVNPDLQQKGLLMVYNPLSVAIKKTIQIPLYYTGLVDNALIREQEGKAIKYSLDRDRKVILEIQIPAKGYNWYTFE